MLMQCIQSFAILLMLHCNFNSMSFVLLNNSSFIHKKFIVILFMFTLQVGILLYKCMSIYINAHITMQ